MQLLTDNKHESNGSRNPQASFAGTKTAKPLKEVPATLQLYLDDKMEQFWLRENEAGVIFLMSVQSVDEADKRSGKASRHDSSCRFRATETFFGETFDDFLLPARPARNG